MRTIGLDYDDTFSVHPAAWAHAMAILRQIGGFRILGVTFRNREQEITCPHYHTVCDAIIYTAGKPKHKTAQDLGHVVDIWIDDKPQWIHPGYDYASSDFIPQVSHPDSLLPILLVSFAPMPMPGGPNFLTNESDPCKQDDE